MKLHVYSLAWVFSGIFVLQCKGEEECRGEEDRICNALVSSCSYCIDQFGQISLFEYILIPEMAHCLLQFQESHSRWFSLLLSKVTI